MYQKFSLSSHVHHLISKLYKSTTFSLRSFSPTALFNSAWFPSFILQIWFCFENVLSNPTSARSQQQCVKATRIFFYQAIVQTETQKIQVFSLFAKLLVFSIFPNVFLRNLLSSACQTKKISSAPLQYPEVTKTMSPHNHFLNSLHKLVRVSQSHTGSFCKEEKFLKCRCAANGSFMP